MTFNSNRLSNKPLTSYQQLMLNTFFPKTNEKAISWIEHLE